MTAPGTAYDDPVLGKDPQPANMKDFYDGYDDNGGVHINSGIPNRAFALAAIAMRGQLLGEGGADLVLRADPAAEPHVRFQSLRRGDDLDCRRALRNGEGGAGSGP